jgi:hypothetical protein
VQKALVGCLLFAVAGAPLLAADNSYSIGVGAAAFNSEVDGGAELDGNGGFVAFRVNARARSFLLVTLSLTQGDDTANVDTGTSIVGVGVEDKFTRLGITAGYTFRKDSMFRFFVHGGFAYLGVEEEVAGVSSVDDSSIALCAGGGVEVGKGHHAFFSSAGFDYEHEVDYALAVGTGSVGGRSTFNMLEVQVGYVYSF